MAENNLILQYPNLKEKVILNVDDNEMNQLVMAKIMENAGLKMISATNGKLAVEKLNEGLKPDVILLDLAMPVMNGVETADHIRNHIDPQIPIIINSGAVGAYERWKLKRLGIAEFLEKPYSMLDIFSKISKSLSFAHAEAN